VLQSRLQIADASAKSTYLRREPHVGAYTDVPE
jgi:hypothetical protein